jgi:hypothetical protein
MRDRIKVTVPASGLIEAGPDVKYRGIFMNDEERTIDWAKSKYPTDQGTPDVNFYRHIFELTLRLRLNVWWPAMHEGTTASTRQLIIKAFPSMHVRPPNMV